MDEHGIEPKRDTGPCVSRRTFALGAWERAPSSGWAA